MTTHQQYRPPHQEQPARVVERVTTLVTPTDSPGLQALRITFYVFGTLASIAFLLVLLYVNIKITEFQDSMSDLFGGASTTAPPFEMPPLPPSPFDE